MKAAVAVLALALAAQVASAQNATAAAAATASTEHYGRGCRHGQAWCRGRCCPPTFVCRYGRCACPWRTTACAGKCVPDRSPFWTTNANCGRCGRACRGGTTCQRGLRGHWSCQPPP